LEQAKEAKYRRVCGFWGLIAVIGVIGVIGAIGGYNGPGCHRVGERGSSLPFCRVSLLFVIGKELRVPKGKNIHPPVQLCAGGQARTT